MVRKVTALTCAWLARRPYWSERVLNRLEILSESFSSISEALRFFDGAVRISKAFQLLVSILTAWSSSCAVLDFDFPDLFVHCPLMSDFDIICTG